MSFFSNLTSRVDQVGSLLCIGLDPHPGDLIENTAMAAKDFCHKIIEATLDLAAAYKPNIAFFEALGPDGLQALMDIIHAIPDQVPVILDAKRGDIASTAEAYVQAVFHTLGADAVTINPYLGRDSVQPFLVDPNKGVFLLCKTSNPGASDLQDLLVQQEQFLSPITPLNPTFPLFLQVARLANDWNTRDNLGLVVGATQPESLAQIRSVAPQLWILAPGVGTQGGDLEKALAAGLRQDGKGILVPVSRAISRSENPRKTAEELSALINRSREQLTLESKQIQSPLLRMESVHHTAAISDLADGLLEAECIKFGKFTLKSGVESPIYIDLRRLIGYPQLLTQVAQAYLPLLEDQKFDTLAALPYAALPITSAISLLSGWSMIYPRKEVKTYGTKAQIEGVYRRGDTAVVIDDLVSTGGSKFEGIDALASEGLLVHDIVVLIDRTPDKGAAINRKGYRLHAVLTLPQLLDYYHQSGRVQEELVQAVWQFLAEQKQNSES